MPESVLCFPAISWIMGCTHAGWDYTKLSKKQLIQFKVQQGYELWRSRGQHWRLSLVKVEIFIKPCMNAAGIYLRHQKSQASGIKTILQNKVHSGSAQMKPKVKPEVPKRNQDLDGYYLQIRKSWKFFGLSRNINSLNKAKDQVWISEKWSTGKRMTG